ncbi:MAG: IS1634 family transposase [PVC group bacterium]|nr:IS1634 family transposase [PVC group bacterium]
MHLNYSTSKYKGKTYKSYSIAESVRDGKTVRKRKIWAIGKLTDEQAEQIKFILKSVKGKDTLLTKLNDIVVADTQAYLDIAVVNEIWNKWQLDKAFDFDVTSGDLPTYTIAKILTINRCTDPCSNYSVPKWAKKVALQDVIKIGLSGLNDDKIYYELDKIHKNQTSIENHLFRRSHKNKPESFDFINYDLSTSYFVGYKCDLSAFGKGKIECHGRRQVLLGVLINDEGYPFKWDVFPGNTAEVNTLRKNINACKTRFKLGGTNVTLVFDRGIISKDNAELIEKAKMKYISALDRNQISSCGVDLKAFKKLKLPKNRKDIAIPEGFNKYDDLYFCDNGIIDEKRLITGFNPCLFKEDRTNRIEKIDFFKTYLKNENKSLKNAKRDRQLDATKGRVVNELKRLKIKKYFDTPTLHPIIIQRKLKDGTIKQIKSFQIEIKNKKSVIEENKLLDGLCIFISNHTKKQGRGFKLKPQSIIKAYRDKTKIEDVFKNVKSFLKIRPFFVNTDNHVKAVYTICILGYLINKYLANQRKETGEKDFLNSKELYSPFKDVDIVSLEDSKTGKSLKKSARIPEATQKLLEKLGMGSIVYGQEK